MCGFVFKVRSRSVFHVYVLPWRSPSLAMTFANFSSTGVELVSKLSSFDAQGLANVVYGIALLKLEPRDLCENFSSRGALNAFV